MSERPEPFLAERVWAHPSDLLTNEVTATGVFDQDGRLVGTEYSDGERETYGYDDRGRVVAID
jgi:YD repeat-containing protein